MEEKKTSIIALLNILKEYSDNNHPLSISDINRHLELEYGIVIDRRTIYHNIDMLEDLGYDISDYKDNGKGYYLIDRVFEKSEVLLLSNIVHASNLIPSKNSLDLINKLLKTQSKYIREEFKNNVLIENHDKKENKEFFYNIEMIEEAILNKKNIEFYYYQYNTYKKLVKRREEKYVVSPYYLVCKNSKIYLVGKSLGHNDFSHYRVDKIGSINKSLTAFIDKKKNENPYDYIKNKTFMYNDKTVKIVARCDYEILDDLIDIFGQDITIHKDDDNHFLAYFDSTKKGMFYLALQYLQHLEILEPLSLRESIYQELIKKVNEYK